MEERWRKHGGRSVREEKPRGNLWREIWRKNYKHPEVKMSGSDVGLSQKSSILTMIEVS